MRRTCCFHRLFLHVLIIAEKPGHGTHAHRCSVTVRTVRLRVVAFHPVAETASIASHGHRIASAPVVQRLSIVAFVHDGVGNGDGADGVIRIVAFVRKQFKSLFWSGSEFESAAYNVSNDSSEHNLIIL